MEGTLPDLHVAILDSDLGTGTAKAGLTVRTTQHKLTYAALDGGAYFFADPVAATDGAGYLVRSGGSTPTSSFSTTELGFFTQYQWQPGPGLRASLGGRADLDFLPKSQVLMP